MLAVTCCAESDKQFNSINNMDDSNASVGVPRPLSSLISLVRGLGIKVPLEPAPTRHSKENSISIVVKPRPTTQASPKRVNPRPLSPRPGSPRLLSPRAGSPRTRSPQHIMRNVSPRLSSPRRVISPKNSLRSLRPTSPRSLYPRPSSPRLLSPRPASPRVIRKLRPNTDRPLSPRPQSPTSQRVVSQRNGSSKITVTQRASLLAKTEAPPKRQLFGKPKPKVQSTTMSPQPKLNTKAGLSSTLGNKSQTTLNAKPDNSDSPPVPAVPQNSKEMEATKAMVSPRIEFDSSRSQSPSGSPPSLDITKKIKPVLRTPKPKESQNTVLNSLVTKVEATSDPSDAGKSKAEIITRKHLYQTFRGLKMARGLPPADPLQLQAKRVVLMKPPGKYRRKTAIFDLDETLVHCLDRSETAVPDVVLPIRFPNGDIVHVTST